MTNRHQVVVIQKDGQHPLPEPASVRRMVLELFVPEAAVKSFYDKFAIPSQGDRRIRLADEAIRRGAVTLTMLRDNGTHEE